ncbi:MAG: UDP-3-O-(3-hydroxymyristoyl)glucosamine N-acyltransferase [Candidatus Hydrogenedentes bacterium]|nr:UDP-3-O-(3-hydroxymyristoyl)glucosamine N-acyltransferase [Candidatus Hydrogenedentota bacterium]
MNATVGEIADLVGGVVQGDRDVRVTGLCGIRQASPGDLTFLSDARYAVHLRDTQAAAVLVSRDISEAPCARIQVDNPYMAMLVVSTHFYGGKSGVAPGVHSSASVGKDVTLGRNVSVDALARVSDGCVLGDDVVVHAGASLGSEVRLGAGTVVHANATLYDRTVTGERCIIHSGAVIGADGFGFVQQNGENVKIPQLGNVVLGNDVEVGANSAVDRATFGSTTIGDGTKIDNLVQIGHNVQIGKHCIICGNAGIAGSSILGNHVMVGAASGVAGHIEVGDGVVVAAQSGVTKSVKAGTVVFGFPAMEQEHMRRMQAALRNLPEALRRLRQLEHRLEQLEGNGTPEDHS